MQRLSKHKRFILRLIIPIKLIAKIYNLHRCLTKLGESDCTQRYLLLPLSWAQHVPVQFAVTVGHPLSVGIQIVYQRLEISKNSISYFFFLPGMCTHNQCKKVEPVLKTHINFEKHRRVPYTQCMYMHKSALQRPTVLQEGCAKYYGCCICQKTHPQSSPLIEMTYYKFTKDTPVL